MTTAPHTHTHTHSAREKLSRLRIALALTVGGMALEFVGGFISNSLALISDAGHMLTHVFALGMSFFAVVLSLRPATKKKTYGFYRAEVLAAFVNGIFLILISLYLIYESVLRFISPEEIRVGEMFIIAVVGLVINGVSTALLARVSHGDLNIRGAFLHEIGDMVSSIAVVLSAAAIFYTKNYIFDPLLSFFISILIIIWAVKLLVDSSNILLESTPKHFDIDDIARVIKEEIAGIHDVNHIHAWTIASSMYAMTAHVVIDDCQVSKTKDVLHRINEVLKRRFHIDHTNIHFECLIKPK